MKRDKNEIRNKWVTLRMNEAEYKLLEQNRRRTTEKTNSDYLRKLALHLPLTQLTRNQSIDECTAALIGIKKELNMIGQNLNQVVHKLHTLDRIAEFRSWAEQYEATRQSIQEATTGLLVKAYQILQQWSQK